MLGLEVVTGCRGDIAYPVTNVKPRGREEKLGKHGDGDSASYMQEEGGRWGRQ